MTRNKTLLAGILGFFILLAASTSSAHWTGNFGQHGSMMGGGYFTLDPAQEKKAQEIETKYQDELAAKEKAVREKVAELRETLTKDSTTIAEANRLREDAYKLEKDYWSLRDKVNQEISSATGTTYYGPRGKNQEFCDRHDDLATGHMYGHDRRHAQGPMMGYGGSWCNNR